MIYQICKTGCGAKKWKRLKLSTNSKGGEWIQNATKVFLKLQLSFHDLNDFIKLLLDGWMCPSFKLNTFSWLCQWTISQWTIGWPLYLTDTTWRFSRIIAASLKKCRAIIRDVSQTLYIFYSTNIQGQWSKISNCRSVSWKKVDTFNSNLILNVSNIF